MHPLGRIHKTTPREYETAATNAEGKAMTTGDLEAVRKAAEIVQRANTGNVIIRYFDDWISFHSTRIFCEECGFSYCLPFETITEDTPDGEAEPCCPCEDEAIFCK